MNTEQRARFEAIHPKPEYVFWHNVSYRIHTPTLVFDISILTNYQKKWEEFQAAETPLLERIAELEGQLANREPFVVKMPESCLGVKPYSCYEGGWNDALDEAKEAITAAGGVCE